MNTSHPDLSDLFTPAMLRSGYVRYYLDDQDGWLFTKADDDISAWVTPLDEIRRQQLLNRLAATFEFPMSAELEANLDTTSQPATLLRLWETMADTWDYFTSGKKLSAAAQRDYFHILLRLDT